MRKALGKKLKVGCFVYEVIFNHNSDADHGETSNSEKKIWINTRFSEQVQRETLNHEIMHVAFEDCAYFGKEYDADKQEEDIIRYASPKQVQIYRDNKWARKFVFGEDK